MGSTFFRTMSNKEGVFFLQSTVEFVTNKEIALEVRYKQELSRYL